MKTYIVIGAVVALVVAGGAWYWLNRGPASPIFVIEGQQVTLINGRAESATATASTSSPQAGSAAKTVTQYFGNVAIGDLNGDGASDVAFLLTQNRGGSGTFYYVVVTLVNPDGSYRGTNGILLGDRIAPQTTEIKDGEVIVNYADRAPGEPMTAQPSEGKSMWLKVDPATMQLVVVPQAVAPPAPVTVTSGVRGKVLIGPTCPVESIPPNPGCADRPYATAISVRRAGSTAVVASGESDATGAFTFSLPPGSYTLTPAGGTPLPRCSPVAIVVIAAGFVTADISCDSGIR